MSKMKKLLFGFAMFLVLFLPISAKAGELPEGENPLIYEARNGVLQINLTYVDEEGKNRIVQGGSGFLIGDETSAEYLVTNYDFLNVTEELRQRAAEESGAEDSERLQFQIQVVVKRDITINAEIITYSEEMDIAVLKLSKSIYDKTAMVLDVDADAVSETANVYTLGFPEEIQQMQDISYYTQEDVSVMNGMVSKKTTINGILYIQHSAVVSGGNSGGPLLDEAGHVIGMNQVLLNDGYYYSVHISEIASILDALGIPYTEYIPEVTVDASLLEAAVNDAEIKALDHYTPDSVEHFLLVLEDSKTLLSKEDLTQEEADQALLQLKSAEAELAVKSGFNYYLLIGGGVVLLLFIAVILLLVMLIKSRRHTKRQAESTAETITPQKQADMASQPVVAASAAGRAPDNGSLRGRYSFLQQGVMGETTVLGAESDKNLIAATLIRIKNNEKIVIQKLTFYLGKDAQKADYCIRDNPSVSRSHAVIKQINGGFYLEDLQATNGTFHNGVRLQPSQSVRLSNGDQIRLADEEFRILL